MKFSFEANKGISPWKMNSFDAAQLDRNLFSFALEITLLSEKTTSVPCAKELQTAPGTRLPLITQLTHSVVLNVPGRSGLYQFKCNYTRAEVRIANANLTKRSLFGKLFRNWKLLKFYTNVIIPLKALCILTIQFVFFFSIQKPLFFFFFIKRKKF